MFQGIPKLSVDLGSSVSSVSDPEDISGLSDEAKKKSAKQGKASGLSESEGSTRCSIVLCLSSSAAFSTEARAVVRGAFGFFVFRFALSASHS